MAYVCQFRNGGSAPATPGFIAVAPEWLFEGGTACAAPAIPAAESTLGSHPCVALSSAQVFPEWSNRNLAGNTFPANGDYPLNFVSHSMGSLQFGWAVLLDRHKPADSILMTCMSDNSIVGVAQADLGRPDVPERLHDPRFLRSGWKMDVLPSKLPPGGCELKAWAFDGQKNEAVALNGSNRAYR